MAGEPHVDENVAETSHITLPVGDDEEAHIYDVEKKRAQPNYMEDLSNTQLRVLTRDYHRRMSRSPPCRKGAIHRLPNEILCQIFLQTVPIRNGRTFELPKPTTRDSPISLRRVCRRWRQIVLTSPSQTLWCSLGLTYRKGVPDRIGFVKDVAAIAEFASRSGNYPLSFSLHYRDRVFSDKIDEERWEAGIHEVVKKIIKHSHRWTYLDVCLPGSACARISSIVPWNIPRLQTMIVEPTSSSWELNGSTMDLPTTQHPLSFDPLIEQSHANLVTCKLRRLYISLDAAAWLYMTLTECWWTINMCPLLEVLEFPVASAGEWVAFDRVLQAAHLKDFTLFIGQCAPDPGPLFDSLSMPALQRLNLTIDDSDNPRQLPELAYFIERSKPPLKVLRCHRIPSDEQDVLECLKVAPCLTTLHIEGITITDETLRALTQETAGGMCINPCLQNISFAHCIHMSYQAMVPMIMARWMGSDCRSTRALRRLSLIHCGSDLSRSLLRQHVLARRCIEEGLILEDQRYDDCILSSDS
ncbi:hypothetical protein BD410DRAFT_782938 [Rickenella mellea]|uniref:Uncharacterized protein n=1 Tax=Rickenella mellea TaxID=50990 RepID=A0A4Y7QGS0_9AGAM|nr:hypothetical protein BD410DRAFT_782938 [Rickenella mellea]